MVVVVVSTASLFSGNVEEKRGRLGLLLFLLLMMV